MLFPKAKSLSSVSEVEWDGTVLGETELEILVGDPEIVRFTGVLLPPSVTRPKADVSLTAFQNLGVEIGGPSKSTNQNSSEAVAETAWKKTWLVSSALAQCFIAIASKPHERPAIEESASFRSRRRH